MCINYNKARGCEHTLWPVISSLCIEASHTVKSFILSIRDMKDDQICKLNII